MKSNWNVTSQVISGDFAKVSNFSELKNFTIALSVFMIADSQIEITLLSNFIKFHKLDQVCG